MATATEEQYFHFCLLPWWCISLWVGDIAKPVDLGKCQSAKNPIDVSWRSSTALRFQGKSCQSARLDSDFLLVHSPAPFSFHLSAPGLENEGWFDPWSLLTAFRRKAVSLGARYLNAELVSFKFNEVRNAVLDEEEYYRPVNHAIVSVLKLRCRADSPCREKTVSYCTFLSFFLTNFITEN